MISHILALTRRIIREIYRDELFILNAVFGPIIALYIIKIAAKSIEGLAMEYIPLEAIGIGFACLLIHLYGYILCTLVIVRERISGTLERVFVATFERREVLLGYVLGYSTVILGQTIIILGASYYFFNLKYGHNIIPVFIIAFLLGIVSIGLAIFISNFARRESHALVGIPLILLPALLLSGLIFPIEALPWSLAVLSYFFPLRYAITSLQGMLLLNKNFSEVIWDFVALIVYGILTLILGSVTLKDRE